LADLMTGCTPLCWIG